MPETLFFGSRGKGMKLLSSGAIFSYTHFLFIGFLSFEALSLQITMQLPVNWLECSEDMEGKISVAGLQFLTT